MNSLKGNVVLNVINTITSIIFPVITFPYASRILTPEGIGAVNFLFSIVQYVVLLTSIGIPMYAIREIAKYRDDRRLRNNIAVEIIILHLILSLFGYVIIYLLGRFVPQIHDQLELLYILSLTVLFNCIGVNWFYQGIEDFLFITVRAVIVRTLAAAALFIFVKDRSDLLIYGAVVVGTSVGNNLFNFIHLRSHISLKDIDFGSLNIMRHFRPALHIFVFNLITSIYVHLDSVMLGFMKGDTSVGLYTAGVKLSHIILSVVTSLGVVMIPRCSNLIQQGEHDKFALISRKAIRLVVFAALPMAAGLMLTAQPVIALFCGSEFMMSVPVLYWVSPIILFVGITNVLGLQILYPQNRENIVIWSVAGGAAVNFLLNLVLIPVYAQKGAAAATFCAELTVLCLQIVLGRRYIPFKFTDCRFMPYVAAVAVMIAAVLPVVLFVRGPLLQILLSVSVGCAVYCGYLLLRRDDTIMDIKGFLLKTVAKRC
ncbi:MAG: flippase [Alistipes sp.]|nr:flippase [Alistipes sp.]